MYQATMLQQVLSQKTLVSSIVLPNFVCAFFTYHKASPRDVFFTHL